MAVALLELLSYKPGATKLTLVNGTAATGYQVGSGQYQPDWGNAVWAPFQSGPRGTQGSRIAGAEPQDRPLSIPVAIQAGTTDAMQASLSVLWDMDEEWRRFGGAITLRLEGATYKSYFDVLSSSARIVTYDHLYHNQNYVIAELAPICAPLLRHDLMDVYDGFETDSSADYTKDVDGAVLGISGGALTSLKSGTTRWRHTAKGYAYGDAQATIKLTTGSTVASYSLDLFVNGDTAGLETFFSAQLQGGNLNVAKWVVGVNTWPATSVFAISANKTYWLQIRREGRKLTANVFNSEPTPLATPAATATYTMTAKENAQTVVGHPGFRLAAAVAGERYDDLRFEPYTYVGLSAPDERALRPQVIGDAPALVDLSVTHGDGTGSAPIFALGAWWQRPSVWNYVSVGDFEDDVDGWSISAVSGVLANAGTSIVRNTTAGRTKYGAANGLITCPATANSGAAFKINRRFYQGRDYVVLFWASSGLATTNARIRLGVSGDIASSASSALSATPTLYATTWTPTADRDGAYVVAEITAATATSWNIDGVVVIESRPGVSSATINAGASTATLERIPDDWPAVPFLAILANAEIVRVTAVDTATNIVTMDRGLEQTTSVTVSAPAIISPLPEIRSHYEGKGAQPPVGIIEAESADAGNLYTWAVAASASYRFGTYLKAGDALAGAGSAFADWLIDPNLLVPDDYTQNEIGIEVWGRMVLHSGLSLPRTLLTLTPENSTVSSGTVTSLYGHTRYAEEWGSAQRALPITDIPTTALATFYRLGTVRMTVDRANPLRSRLGLKVSWGSATTGALFYLDYLVLAPQTGCALSPTGQYFDANYPEFIKGIQETKKTIRSDLSGLVSKPPAPAYPDHGLSGGGLLEIPAGPVDSLLKLSSSPPDEPVPATSEQLAHTVALHYAVTPRSRTARSS